MTSPLPDFASVPSNSSPGFDEHRLRRLLEGDGTFLSAALRTGLYLPGKAYGLVMALRRIAYGAGVYASFPAGLPTVSVGNLTAGGSGKTPTVALLATRLLERGHRPGILMRGYARTAGGESDEAVLYRSLVPRAILAVNPDRRAGAAAAKRDGATILLMDDGFQHRRLRRDLDIVLIDATSPWGGGNTLPGGLLREPKSALKAANAIVVTRSDQADAVALAGIMAEIARIAPGIPVASARHRPARLYTPEGESFPPDTLKGKDVVVLSGIARPEAFIKTLTQLGANPVAVFAKPDHHPLERGFVLQAIRAAEASGAVAVTTEKDYAKPLFQKPDRETADNTNSNQQEAPGFEEAVSSLRVLGVEQEIDGLESLLDMILKIAPIGRGTAD